MNKEIILWGVIALLVGGIGGYAFAQKESDWGSFRYQHVEEGVGCMHDTMAMQGGATPVNHMDHMQGMVVASERAFIEGMIPHHQEAVDTAKEVIERGGTTPVVKKLVEDIVVAQEAEIAEMKEWYADWYGEAYEDTDEYVPLMRELEDLPGVEIDRVFLEDMIGHHMGAIMMAESVQPHIEHGEVGELTDAIVSTQSAEIAQMRQMLQEL